MEPSEIDRRLLCSSHIGFADDFNEWYTGTIQVHIAVRTAFVVHQLTRVFLHVNSGNADPPCVAIDLNVHITGFGEGIGILGYLVALG